MKTSTINLLPPKFKRLNHTLDQLTKIARVLVVLIILSLLATASLIALRLTITASITSKQVSLKNLQQQIAKLSEIERQIATINERVQSGAQSTQKQINWPTILQELSNVTPDGVKLNTIKMSDQLDKPWELTGSAADERVMLALQSKLEASALFANATITNTSLAQGKDKTNRSFIINFELENGSKK